MLIGIDASRAFVAERTGTENYSYELITHLLRLTKAKKHIFVLFIRPNAKLPNELDGYDNVKVKVINFPFLWTQVGLALATWGTKLDVLWIPAHTLPLLRKRDLKTVVTIHGLEYKYLPEYKNWLQRWYLPLSTWYAARAAERLICVSENTKRELVAETEIDAEKCSVIYEGANEKSEIRSKKHETREGLERYGLDEKKYILFVGTVQPRKNLGSLIRAFAKVHNEYPDHKLVIAGKVGWDAAEVLALPEQLGVAEAIVFAGRVSPVALQCLYQGARLYVQPSWTEGFGLPVLEAMANGIPTVVSNGGALPEVVGEAGVVVELKPNFVDELARAIAGVLGDPQLAKQLKMRGRKRVAQLTWQKAASESLDLLTTG